jgi:hypothetical protein
MRNLPPQQGKRIRVIGMSAALRHPLDEVQNKVHDPLLCAASPEIDRALIDIALLGRAGLAQQLEQVRVTKHASLEVGAGKASDAQRGHCRNGEIRFCRRPSASVTNRSAQPSQTANTSWAASSLR